jgi:hypothetical protein
MLALQSSELAPPSPACKCCPTPFGSGGGGTHSLADKGAGGASSEERTNSLVTGTLGIWYNPSTHLCNYTFVVLPNSVPAEDWLRLHVCRCF